jgi:hypothetical protein
MKPTNKAIEQAAHDVMRTHAQTITRLNHKPTRMDLINMKEEIETTLVNIDISKTYGTHTVDAEGNNYGCLAGIYTEDEYLNHTTCDWDEPTEPDYYDPNITDAMPRHVRKRKEEVHNQRIVDYWTWKGTMRGLANNIRDAIEEKYYIALKHPKTKYNIVTPLEILQHVQDTFAPMDTRSKKAMRAQYYQPWNVGEGELLDTFTQRLINKRVILEFNGININDDELNEHYIDQMYTSKQFAPDEMKAWEENDEDDKDNWDFIVDYFSTKMAAINRYLQNNGDDTKFDSAANVTQEEELANAGDEIQKYILTLTQANEKQHEETAAIVTDIKKDEMAERLMKLESMMEKLLANIPTAPGKPKDGKKPKESDEKHDTRKFRFNRNMGGYCHSCGYHPIARKHDSKTCKTKKEGHDNDATWANHGPNGCNWWPNENKVNDKDKDHASYKNKTAPTN